jgi:glycerate 2-kinase
MASIPTTVLVAPDSFKGTLQASTVAEAIGRGLEAGGRPVDLCPLADGGEGTLEVLFGALGGELVKAPATDPLGRAIEAAFGLVEDRRAGLTAIVETAAASGLSLLAPGELDPIGASTTGTGQLILAAREAGAKVIYLGVGGSATTDGGSGVIQAIRKGGGLDGVRLVVLCDVRTPFEHAAQVYGPQKGADAPMVARLTARLHALARRFDRDPRGLPLTGAAGGLSGGLWAELGAEPVPGVRARPGRLRPADAGLSRCGHRRGTPRRAEPGRQGRLRGMHSSPPGGRTLPRNRGQPRA